jgi:hypothetical protein
MAQFLFRGNRESLTFQFAYQKKNKKSNYKISIYLISRTLTLVIEAFLWYIQVIIIPDSWLETTKGMEIPDRSPSLLTTPTQGEVWRWRWI